MTEIDLLRAEVEHLREQRDWLQRSNGELLTRARAAEAEVATLRHGSQPNRRADVIAFFGAIGDGHHVGATPHKPPSDSLRLGLLLLVEEVGETVLACFDGSYLYPLLVQILGDLRHVLVKAEAVDFQVDMPAFIDGLVDTDYVRVGLLVRCGVDDAPVWDLVHAANMTKAGGPRDPVTNKKLKPEGFQPPDVAGELKRQGWEP
jgi:predicted HAD superfamily Cof-like phosphohydrolase